MSVELEEVYKFEKRLMKHGKILNLKSKDDFTNQFFREKGHSIEHLKSRNYIEY